MQTRIPQIDGYFSMDDGPFGAADTSTLTGLPATQLQHWTNKGYLGKGKTKIGRGVRRTYTAGEVEMIAIAKDLTECSMMPSVALEYAALIVHKAEIILEKRFAQIVAKASRPGEIANALFEMVPTLVANLRMNAEPGDASAVQIGDIALNQMFHDGRPALLVPFGILKMELGQRLQQLKQADHEMKESLRSKVEIVRRQR